jgi:carboxypeptidase A3
MNRRNRIVSYISFHAYGSMWLSPFAYSRHHIQENFVDTCYKAKLATNKIQTAHNYTYRFGSASHELYESSGCNPDWASSIGIKHAYAIELKPKEPTMNNPYLGFEYPENELKQVGLEMFDGLIEYIRSFLVNNKSNTNMLKECKVYYNEMVNSLNDY